jgi:hypothetical protein
MPTPFMQSIAKIRAQSTKKSPQKKRTGRTKGRTGETHLSTEMRPAVVDASPLRQQRPHHVLPNQDRLPALHPLMLRLGGTFERATGSIRSLVTCGSTTTHHLEGVQGRATHIPFVPTATARTENTSARRQSSGGSCAHSPHVPVANNDERISRTM